MQIDHKNITRSLSKSFYLAQERPDCTILIEPNSEKTLE